LNQPATRFNGYIQQRTFGHVAVNIEAVHLILVVLVNDHLRALEKSFLVYWCPPVVHVAFVIEPAAHAIEAVSELV
jgi:hypothetical protein